MTIESVSSRIKEKRKEQRLTQQELANKIGVSLMTVLRWEKGERTPNTLIMPQIAGALNTSVEYLMGLQPSQEMNQLNMNPSEKVELPGLAYWGGVADNARRVARDGQNLSLIYSLLSDAAGTIKLAMNRETGQVATA